MTGVNTKNARQTIRKKGRLGKQQRDRLKISENNRTKDNYPAKENIEEDTKDVEFFTSNELIAKKTMKDNGIKTNFDETITFLTENAELFPIEDDFNINNV